MTLFGYRFGLRFFTLIGLVSLLIFVFGLDPESLSVWGVVFFFVSMWVVACGLFSLAFLFLYEKAIGAESTAHFVGGALRQGILLGSSSVTLAAFQYLGIFAWWTALLAVAFFLLLEFTLRHFFVRT